MRYRIEIIIDVPDTWKEHTLVRQACVDKLKSDFSITPVSVRLKKAEKVHPDHPYRQHLKYVDVIEENL